MQRHTHTLQASPLFSPGETLTVSELATKIRSQIEGSFGFVRVVGEIGSVTQAASGHVYFVLKDDQASLSAVMFRTAALRLKDAFPPQATQVECLGRLTFYQPRGKTQLVVEWLVTQGAGLLGLRFMQLKSKLEAEGLFDPKRKRPLPKIPNRIGVVTSPTGAAIRDILQVLDRRFPSIPVVLFPVPVQGEGCAERIAEAVYRMGQGDLCDVLIVGRGGGSAEDLFGFNEEVVVRAVACSKVPTISAVGHEVDLVLTDLVADVRAPTPSAAAELVVLDREILKRTMKERIKLLLHLIHLELAASQRLLLELSRQIRDPWRDLNAYRMRIDDAQRRATSLLEKQAAEARQRLVRDRERLFGQSPLGLALRVRAILERAQASLPREIDNCLQSKRKALKAQKRTLEGLSPWAILERGYSIVQKTDGRIVKKAAELDLGDEMRIRLHQGLLTGRVTQKE